MHFRDTFPRFWQPHCGCQQPLQPDSDAEQAAPHAAVAIESTRQKWEKWGRWGEDKAKKESVRCFKRLCARVCVRWVRLGALVYICTSARECVPVCVSTHTHVFKRTLCKMNAHGHPLYNHIQQYTRTLSMPKLACSAPSTVCSLNKPQKHKSKKRPTSTRICAHAYPGSSIQPACITSCWMQQMLVNERESI